MLCLVDTNVLLRSLDRNYPHSRLVRRAMIVLRRQDNRLCLLSQNLIEFWAVATRPVDVNGLGMSTDWAAAQLFRMKHFFIVLPDTAAVLPEWESLSSSTMLRGRKLTMPDWWPR